MLLLSGPALGAPLSQLPESLRIVEQTGDALLAHPVALALALPCQGRREVPVVVFKHFAHARERTSRTRESADPRLSSRSAMQSR